MTRVTYQFAFAAILLFSGCAEDKPPVQIATEEQIDLIAEPDSSHPDQVFRYWQRAMDEGRYTDAYRWSSPATIEWIQLIETLEPASDASRDPFITTIDGVRCTTKGDSTICLFAELKEDRLILDSIQLLRLDHRWVIHLSEDKTRKTAK